MNESLKPMPYVYICTHKVTGEFYIGSRTTKSLKHPSHIDLPLYRTSSKKVKPIFDEFDWHIVAEFFDPQDALQFEQEMIYKHWGNNLIINQSCHIHHTVHWSTTGNSHTLETKQKLSDIASKRRWSEDHKHRISKTQQGKSKPCKRADKFYWYNDGIINRLFAENELIPIEFVKGRLMPRNKNNSNNKGKTWSIVNGKRKYS